MAEFFMNNPLILITIIICLIPIIVVIIYYLVMFGQELCRKNIITEDPTTPELDKPVKSGKNIETKRTDISHKKQADSDFLKVEVLYQYQETKNSIWKCQYCDGENALKKDKCCICGMKRKPWS